MWSIPAASATDNSPPTDFARAAGAQ
jgi:hypothetical protein